MSETAEQIAARYGAGLGGDVSVKVIPRGTSARPLPVWDGRKLIQPDWKEHAEAAKRASIKALTGARARDPAVIARQAEVSRLHAEGLSNTEIMAVMPGLTYHVLRSDLFKQGLTAHRDHGAMAERLHNAAARKTEARLALVRKLVDQGLGEERIRAAMGVSDVSWGRRLIRAAVPAFPFENKRPGREGLPEVAARRAQVARLWGEGWGSRRIMQELGIARSTLQNDLAVLALGQRAKPIKQIKPLRGRPAKDGPTPAQRAMAARIAPWLGKLTQSEIGARLGLSRGGVAGQIARLRHAGLLPAVGADERVAA